MTKHAVGRETRPKSPVTLGGPKQALGMRPLTSGLDAGTVGTATRPGPGPGGVYSREPCPFPFPWWPLSAAAGESGTCGSHGARSA